MEKDEKPKGDGSVFGELEDQCTCWICFEIFEEPITLNCNHTFCKDCLLKVYKKNSSCAFCRQPFTLPLPAINPNIIKLVETFLKSKDKPDEALRELVEQTSVFFTLPDEVMMNVFSYLDSKSLCRSAKVCSDFKRVTEDPFLWRELCTSRWPFLPPLTKYANNWKKCYAARSKMQTGWASGKSSDFKMTALRGHTNYVSCFSYYRNNIVSGSADNSLKVWSTDKSDALCSLDGHTGLVTDVRFNEVRIVSSAHDQTVKVWDTVKGSCDLTLNAGSPVSGVQFDADSVFANIPNNVKIFDIRNGQQTRQLNNAPALPHWAGLGGALIYNKSIAHVNNFVAANSNNNLLVWDIRNGNVIATLAPSTGFQLLPDSIVSLTAAGLVHHKITSNQTTTLAAGGYTALSVDKNRAVAAKHNGTIDVFDLATNTKLRTIGETNNVVVNSIQFDDRRVVTGAADNAMKVWDIGTGQKLYALLGGTLQARANNPAHPQRPGCSGLQYDEARIVASFNSLLRIYAFDDPKI